MQPIKIADNRFGRISNNCSLKPYFNSLLFVNELIQKAIREVNIPKDASHNGDGATRITIKRRIKLMAFLIIANLSTMSLLPIAFIACKLPVCKSMNI